MMMMIMMMNDDEGRRIVRTIFASVLNFTFIDARMWVNKSPQSVKIWTFFATFIFYRVFSVNARLSFTRSLSVGR